MTAVQARSPAVEYRKRRAFNPRLAAEKYFKKQANGNLPCAGTEPLCRQTYDLERSLARWRERAHA